MAQSIWSEDLGSPALFVVEASPEVVSERKREEYYVKKSVSGQLLTGGASSLPNPGAWCSIGIPVITPLAKLMHPQSLSPRLRGYLQSVTFTVVQLAVAFGSKCDVPPYDVELAFQLEATRPVSSSSSPDRLPPWMAEPIAYDLYPTEVADLVDVFDAKYLSPTLQFHPNFIPAAPHLPEMASSFHRYSCAMTAFGLQERIFGWRFTQTPARPGSGVQGLYLLIRSPRRARIVAHLHLNVRREGADTWQKLALRDALGVVERPTLTLWK